MRPRRWWAAVVVLAACSGGGEAAGERDPEPEPTTTEAGEEEATTTSSGSSEADPDVVVPDGGHRFETRIGGEIVATGDVQDPEHYRIETKFEGIRSEVVVVGDRTFTRQGDASSLSTALYVELADGERLPPALFDQEQADLAVFDLTVVAAAVDPAALVDGLLGGEADVEPAGDGTAVRGPAVPPDEAVAAAEGSGLELPEIDAEVRLDGAGVPDVAVLSIDTDLGPVAAQVRYTFGGVDPVEAPPPEQIDRTPNINEEALRAFADTALVAPSAPPPAMQLVAATVLTPDLTLEGCRQVHLEYASEELDFMEVFLLPLSCAESFDPSPYDETFGGLPSRFVTTREVLVGDTVVQLAGSLADDELEEVAGSLAPTTADALIAAVAPG